MEAHLPENMEEYAGELLASIRELITYQNGILSLIIYLFMITFIIKIFVFRKDKQLLRDNIVNLVGLIIPYTFLNSILFAYTLSYNSGIKINTIINIFILCYLLVVSILYLLFKKFKPQLKSALNKFKIFIKKKIEELDLLFDDIIDS